MKNPDGSLAQAAMMQSALSKERREVKMQERQENETKNPGSTKNWLDPIESGGFDPSMMAGAGKSSGLPGDLPEWKKHIIGGSKGSFGRKTNMSIMEQRQSLPIYKLKDELIKAINDNQVSQKEFGHRMFFIAKLSVKFKQTLAPNRYSNALIV